MSVGTPMSVGPGLQRPQYPQHHAADQDVSGRPSVKDRRRRANRQQHDRGQRRRIVGGGVRDPGDEATEHGHHRHPTADDGRRAVDRQQGDGGDVRLTKVARDRVAPGENARV